MPAQKWCNCSSEQFDDMVSQTVYCEMDNRFNRIFSQDPRPVKTLRNFSDGGYLFTFAATPTFIPDRWKDYVGWRIPVAVPSTSSLPVGSMAGYIADNGYLGEYNFTSDMSKAVEADAHHAR